MRFASSGVRSSRLGLSCWSDIDISGAKDEAGAGSPDGAFDEHQSGWTNRGKNPYQDHCQEWKPALASVDDTL